jgi:hypothetical protein
LTVERLFTLRTLLTLLRLVIRETSGLVVTGLLPVLTLMTVLAMGLVVVTTTLWRRARQIGGPVSCGDSTASSVYPSLFVVNPSPFRPTARRTSGASQ